MIKFFLKFLLVVAILGGLGYAAYLPIQKYLAERSKPKWRTASVDVGGITKTVNATGKIKPTKSVQVGTFVSGPILEMYVEFNQEVKQNELLCKIDPLLYAANVARDRASLASRKAEVKRVEALLQQARNDETRAAALREENVDFIAQSELDQVKFNRMSLEAQLTIAEASILGAQATLENSQASLGYCEIRSPEDGMIIDRKVQPGQTLAAQFQTPELFIVGVGLREKMHIFADVDESEIGMIRDAEKSKQPVSFTVNAYPDDVFHGMIEEVRFSSAELQNVVTYPVVVGSPNPDLKLLPGMTADLSFQIRKIENVIRIPKSALRFYPPNVKWVHPDDRHLLEGAEFAKAVVDETTAEVELSQTEQALRSPALKLRHVWKLEGELLKAIEVTIGLSDNQYSELLSGDLVDGTELIIGQKTAGEQ